MEHTSSEKEIIEAIEFILTGNVLAGVKPELLSDKEFQKELLNEVKSQLPLTTDKLERCWNRVLAQMIYAGKL